MTMKVYKGMERKGRGEILCPFNVLRAVFSLSPFHHPPPLSARMAWMPAEIVGQIMPVAAGAAARNSACKGKDARIWFKGPDI